MKIESLKGWITFGTCLRTRKRNELSGNDSKSGSTLRLPSQQEWTVMRAPGQMRNWIPTFGGIQFLRGGRFGHGRMGINFIGCWVWLVRLGSLVWIRPFEWSGCLCLHIYQIVWANTSYFLALQLFSKWDHKISIFYIVPICTFNFNHLILY